MRWLAGLVLGSALFAAAGRTPPRRPLRSGSRAGARRRAARDEPFTPAPVETFLTDSIRAGAGLDNRFCLAKDGFAALDCYDARTPRTEAARTERRGTRPLVYVALGSHATYFGAGRRPLDPP